MTTVPDPANAALDHRYGRTRQRGVDRKLGWAIGCAAVLLGVVVLLFGGWQNSKTVESKVIHYKVENARTVVLEFQVSAPTQAPVACALEALSESYSTVGWKVIELPLSEQRTRNLTESLATTYRATTGTVRSCWLIERAA